jgi:hypothetical protein
MEMTCISCNNDEAARGMDCVRCATVNLLGAMVFGKWLPDEYADLCTTLRSASVRELRAQRKGAAFLQNLLGTLQRLCAIRRLDEDMMRLSLAKKIDRQLAYMVKVAEWDTERGAGDYMRSFGIACQTALQQVREETTKQSTKPEPAAVP